MFTSDRVDNITFDLSIILICVSYQW